ncbi:hypothetical protein AMEX_G11091 [Astyanax mexicanus]|uniref:DUF4585 domain-containing protein n=1 Tax=Astyanax mexicanus TaxID=7994 RepID=A0A8B9RCQ2_ASTMX|nr:hypothetical protein AMEX_G11091 [Astyanax mexicanus]
MAASPSAPAAYEPEPSYADLQELLDLRVDALRAGFNGEANHVAIVKQTTKWLAGGRAGEGALATAAKEPLVDASCAQFPAKERQESARVNGDVHGTEKKKVEKEEEAEEEEDEEGNDHDDYGDYYYGDEHLSLKSNESSEHELRVLIAAVTDDESHYITTHEIQLSELDHDADCDLSACASWDGEDEHQVYTFVDYASFEREATIVEEEEEEEGEEEEKEEEGDKNNNKKKSSDVAESAQPDIKESGSAPPGRIHLAIRATARAVNGLGGENARKEEKAREGAACLIALPGRLHIGGGRRLKGRDAHEHSSGASSAVSELDDADKEVRNLTSRAFRSLAYPYSYPYALSFSTSSESSASERGKGGVGCWSALVDLKYNKKAPHAGGDTAPQARAQQPLGARESEQRAATAALWARSGVRAPPVEVFALNGSLLSAGGAASARGGGETLELVLRRERRARPAPDGMEEPHRRAALASSLLKSVLSKKVQFERERKMERGEIGEPEKVQRLRMAKEREKQKEKEREKKKEKEREKDIEARGLSDTDISLVCLEELADVVDGSGGSSRDSPREAKKGARGGALPRSQNSAFRSWRDGELGFHEEREGARHTESDGSESGKATKMSRLFVPSIQLAGAERGSGSASASTSSAGGAGGPRAFTVKPPEIKINLRSSRGDKSEAPLTVASALAAALRSEPSERVPHFTVRDVRDNSKGKFHTPIHQVRDVRKLVKSSYHFVSLEGNEGKGGSGNGEFKSFKQGTWAKGSSASASTSASLTPIVIKCQSVNTNSSSNSKQSESLAEPSKCRSAEDAPDAPESDGPSPPALMDSSIKTQGITHVHKPAARVTPASVNQEGLTGVKIETLTAAKKQEHSDLGEKVSDSKMAALEKLQAAVKTMEQLYVFDRNEWKRKREPHPVTDSNVLSLISEEQGNAEVEQGKGGTLSAERHLAQADMSLKKEEKGTFNVSHALLNQNGPKTVLHLGGGPGKSISSMSMGQKISAPITASSVKASQVRASSSSSFSPKDVNPNSLKLPVSFKIGQTKPMTEERERPNGNEAGFTPIQFTSTADAENYLTIPVKPSVKQAGTSVGNKAVVYTFPASAGKTHTVSPPSSLGHSFDSRQNEMHQSPKRSSIVMETRSSDTPTATIYHHPLPISMPAATPQMICFSPTVQPSPVPTEHFQATQRKMLLDPTTGNYYLVDTPVQPATRRLFDPETGQYVDLPMPPQPPMTPVHMPISPLALSPGTYGHTYMFYPGYMPTTVIPARIQSQLSVQSEVEEGDKSHGGQQGDGAYMEAPYYMPSGKSVQMTSGGQHVSAGRAASNKQPVISITSQQGPRIIAPPSFDGTTMSFVVEHR